MTTAQEEESRAYREEVNFLKSQLRHYFNGLQTGAILGAVLELIGEINVISNDKELTDQLLTRLEELKQRISEHAKKFP